MMHYEISLSEIDPAEWHENPGFASIHATVDKEELDFLIKFATERDRRLYLVLRSCSLSGISKGSSAEQSK